MTYKKVDSNQPEIVAALREAGACVQSIAAIGAGCPDLLVAFRGANYLLEVKPPGSERRLTRLEVEWLENWRGQAAVVSSAEQALDIIGASWRPEFRIAYLAMQKDETIYPPDPPLQSSSDIELAIRMLPIQAKAAAE